MFQTYTHSVVDQCPQITLAALGTSVNASTIRRLLTRNRHEIVGTVVRVGSKAEGGLK